MSDRNRDSRTLAESVAKEEALRRELEEARQTLAAIRQGDIDALVVTGPQGEQVYSLAGAEHVYRVIVETMNEAALTVDPEGTILFCNQRFCDLMKTSMQKVMGHKVAAFAAQSQGKLLQTFLADAQRGPVRRRLLLRAADGTDVPVQLSASPLPAGDGLSICLVASDLTELEKSARSLRVLREHDEAMQAANERLQVQMEQLQTLNDMLQARQAQLEAAHAGLCVQGEQLRSQGQALCQSGEWLALAASGTRIGLYDWNVLTGEALWTEQVARLLGLRTTTTTTTTTTTISQRYHYRDWAERVHPEDLARVEAKRQRCRAQGLPLETEYRVIWPDGSVHWLADRGVFQYGSDGLCTRMLGILMDITERKQAEEAWRENQERYRGVVENTTAVILRVDPSGVITFANRRALELFGYAPDELIGRHAVGTIIPARETTGRDLAAMVEEIVARPDRFHSNANENLCRDGRRVWMEWTNSGVYDAQGRLKEFLAVGFDATERRQAEEKLAADLAALTRMHELSRRVVAGTGIEALLQETMDAAVALMQADRGTLQLFEDDTLRIVAHHGHERPFLDFFAAAENVASVCGAATGRGERVVVPDVETSPFFAGTASLPALRAAGVRAVQSTPLRTRAGRLLGILTTQWTRPHTPDEHNLWRLDLLARQTADFIEQKQAEGALRELNATLESRVAERTAELEKERRRLYDVLEAMPAMVCLLTPDYHVAFANRSFREKFGESNGRPCYEFCYGRTQPCDFCETYNVLKTGRPHRWEVASRDGKTIIDAHDFPFTDVDGSPLILEMDLDITDRKCAETALRKMNEALAHRAEQLQRLTLELTQAEERERRRIAVILHEDLQQQIAGAKFHLHGVRNRARDNRLRADADRIDAMLREAIEKSRSLSHDLSPAVLHMNDLAEVLRWLVRRMQTQHGLVARADVPEGMILPSEALTIFLFRVAEELLFNVVKHAGVGQATLRLQRTRGHLRLLVTDPGQGFDPGRLPQTAGVGLLSIRERVSLLGGRMRIRSAPGRGSAVLVVVPDNSAADLKSGPGPEANS